MKLYTFFTHRDGQHPTISQHSAETVEAAYKIWVDYWCWIKINLSSPTVFEPPINVWVMSGTMWVYNGAILAYEEEAILVHIVLTVRDVPGFFPHVQN